MMNCICIIIFKIIYNIALNSWYYSLNCNLYTDWWTTPINTATIYNYIRNNAWSVTFNTYWDNSISTILLSNQQWTNISSWTLEFNWTWVQNMYYNCSNERYSTGNDRYNIKWVALTTSTTPINAIRLVPSTSTIVSWTVYLLWLT